MGRPSVVGSRSRRRGWVVQWVFPAAPTSPSIAGTPTTGALGFAGRVHGLRAGLGVRPPRHRRSHQRLHVQQLPRVPHGLIVRLQHAVGLVVPPGLVVIHELPSRGHVALRPLLAVDGPVGPINVARCQVPHEVQPPLATDAAPKLAHPDGGRVLVSLLQREAPHLVQVPLQPPVRWDDVRGDVDCQRHEREDARDDAELQHEEHAEVPLRRPLRLQLGTARLARHLREAEPIEHPEEGALCVAEEGHAHLRGRGEVPDLAAGAAAARSLGRVLAGCLDVDLLRVRVRDATGVFRLLSDRELGRHVGHGGLGGGVHGGVSAPAGVLVLGRKAPHTPDATQEHEQRDHGRSHRPPNEGQQVRLHHHLAEEHAELVEPVHEYDSRDEADEEPAAEGGAEQALGRTRLADPGPAVDQRRDQADQAEAHQERVVPDDVPGRVHLRDVVHDLELQVVVRLVDNPVGIHNLQRHVAHGPEVHAEAHGHDDDEQVRADRQDRVPGAHGRRRPVGLRVA
mmetsp:Transcript_39626/g.104787  ORF Transcript_39626/g.104787 Transcript_39626/m.104787 type:complete len:511 (-) Transcript_39626:817-2349(-)